MMYSLTRRVNRSKVDRGDSGVSDMVQIEGVLGDLVRGVDTLSALSLTQRRVKAAYMFEETSARWRIDAQNRMAVTAETKFSFMTPRIIRHGKENDE